MNDASEQAIVHLIAVLTEAGIMSPVQITDYTARLRASGLTPLDQLADQVEGAVVQSAEDKRRWI